LGSIRVSRDGLALAPRAQRVVDAGVDGLLHELDRAVSKRHVHPARMLALEAPDVKLVAVAELGLGDVAQVRDAADRPIGRVGLAVLEFGEPVHGDVGPGPGPVAAYPHELTVIVGRVLPDEERIAATVGDTRHVRRLAAAAVAEHALERTVAAPLSGGRR